MTATKTEAGDTECHSHPAGREGCCRTTSYEGWPGQTRYCASAKSLPNSSMGEGGNVCLYSIEQCWRQQHTHAASGVPSIGRWAPTCKCDSMAEASGSVLRRSGYAARIASRGRQFCRAHSMFSYKHTSGAEAQAPEQARCCDLPTWIEMGGCFQALRQPRQSPLRHLYVSVEQRCRSLEPGYCCVWW